MLTFLVGVPDEGADGLLLSSCQRLPFMPLVALQAKPGTNRMDEIVGPLMVAEPHSVSTLMIFISVAPVIESPFSITTVVDASSAEANRIPATSERGTSIAPNELCRLSVDVSLVRVPEIFVSECKLTLTLNGRALDDIVALATGFATVSFGSASCAKRLDETVSAAIAARAMKLKYFIELELQGVKQNA